MTTNDPVLHVGEVCVFTTGEYSGYGIRSLFRVLLDFNPRDLYDELSRTPPPCLNCGKPEAEHHVRTACWMCDSAPKYASHREHREQTTAHCKPWGADPAGDPTFRDDDLEVRLQAAMVGRGLVEEIMCPTIHMDTERDFEFQR